MLLALLVLHSICWLAFFAHLHQSLNTAHYHGGSHLLYAFALSNSLMVLLMAWSQRRSLRRATQLAGLTRLMSTLLCSIDLCHFLSSGCCHASSASSRAASKRAGFYREQQHQQLQQQQHQGNNPNQQGKSGVKVSPSSQSLFLVSQQHQDGRPLNNQQYGLTLQHQQSYHPYGPTYSQLPAGGQQQHLYQQLSNQHIYDSTTNLNEPQHLNVMQLMQQQQQQQFHTLNRLQQQQQQQQQQFNQIDNQQLLVLDAKGAMKQLSAGACQSQAASKTMQHNHHQHHHHEQRSGEADGPLVAFNSSSSSSSQQQQQLPATFGPHSTNQSAPLTSSDTSSSGSKSSHSSFPLQQQALTGHQLFSQQQPASAINCISASLHQRCSTSVADANQHQYYSIRQAAASQSSSSNNNNSNSNNYTDALKAALQQQQRHQQAESAMHFRRANSKRSQQQSVIDHHQLVASCGIDPRECDQQETDHIYNVANYALNQ